MVVINNSAILWRQDFSALTGPVFSIKTECLAFYNYGHIASTDVKLNTCRQCEIVAAVRTKCVHVTHSQCPRVVFQFFAWYVIYLILVNPSYCHCKSFPVGTGCTGTRKVRFGNVTLHWKSENNALQVFLFWKRVLFQVSNKEKDCFRCSNFPV